MRLGPPVYYMVVTTRDHWYRPGVWDYKRCEVSQQGPSYLEKMTMQEYVRQSFDRCGHLWNTKDILLKITEEMGELVRAFRKQERKDQLSEFGDVLFSVLALAEREGIDATDQLCEAVARFEHYCEQMPSSHKCRGCQIQLPTHPILLAHKRGLCVECYERRWALAGEVIDERGLEE